MRAVSHPKRGFRAGRSRAPVRKGARLRPAPWEKSFTVSQRHEGGLYEALKSRLELIDRNDAERWETYRDRQTGQHWRNQYVEQGFGSWYELRPEPAEARDHS